VPPKILIRKIVTELHAQMFKKDELIVEKGQVLEDLMFIYVGVAHLFGYDEWNDETMRHKCITLKKGSWFGDYQILVGVPSEWDLVAGGDSEFNISKKPKGMPRDHILIYKIPSARLITILDKYPLFRSFIVTRSLIRRSYFMKVKNDNMQVLLFEKKKEQHMNVVSALGIRNDFMAGEDSDDEHQDENGESALSLAIAPDENATSDELRQRKEKLARYLSKSNTKKKLLRDAIKLFKRNMQRIVKNKRYDPLHLRNRIELQDYQDEIADLVYNESMNEAVFVGSASSTIT
jgi:signal-transduction protein with cAMP-binding, CBS, and nucleotidyltransferase domain